MDYPILQDSVDFSLCGGTPRPRKKITPPITETTPIKRSKSNRRSFTMETKSFLRRSMNFEISEPLERNTLSEHNIEQEEASNNSCSSTSSYQPVMKEDISKSRSTFIGSTTLPMNKTNIEKSYNFNNNTNIEKISESKSSKLLKLIGMKKSTDQIVFNSKIPSNQQINKQKISNSMNEFSVYSGILIEIMDRIKNECKMVLNSKCLTWDTMDDTKRKSISIQDVTSITASNANLGDSDWPASFEFTVATPTATQVYVFAVRTEQERKNWMQKLLEAVAVFTFPETLACSYMRAGLVDIKDGIGGKNIVCWLLLKEREIFYWKQATETVISADLRLTICIENQRNEEGQHIILHLPDLTLYIQATDETETLRWLYCLKNASSSNGQTLEQQQLTRQFVPVIIDTCINYITTHGFDIEGIYEDDADTETIVVNQLLSKFRMTDARKLHLESLAVLNVAAAMKAFFNKLPSTLFSSNLTTSLVTIAISNASDDKRAEKYRNALEQELSQIELMTSRRLLGHLHFLHLNRENTMDASRLAGAWVPALMPPEYCGEKRRAMADMIVLYPQVYAVSPDELGREMRLQNAVRNVRKRNLCRTNSEKTGNEINKPNSLTVWISIDEYYGKDTVQVKVTPDMTAGQICAEYGQHTDVVLQEYVLGGTLYRPLHPLQLVYDVVLAWSEWDDVDRRDNQLVLSSCSIYYEIRAQGKARALTKGELRFADSNSRHPISCDVELDQTHLHCYRDKRVSLKLGQWKVDDITWYIGSEPKRESFSKWTITFYSRKEKPRTREYFGNQLGGSSNKELHYWSAGLLLAQFPGYL